MFLAFFLLAQTAAAPAVEAPMFDWKHACLAVGMVLAGILGKWWNAGGEKYVESRLMSSGHAQAAAGLEVVSRVFASIATDDEKKKLAAELAAAGVSHPATDAAVAPKSP